jgi:hypothetical protein
MTTERKSEAVYTVTTWKWPTVSARAVTGDRHPPTLPNAPKGQFSLAGPQACNQMMA